MYGLCRGVSSAFSRPSSSVSRMMNGEKILALDKKKKIWVVSDEI
jgi:hypothetical protein